jgi:acyl-homoserine lactone synthase
VVEIHIVRKENRHLYEHLFDAYYRTRHEIYVKQRKWLALDRPDGREIDQFDTDETVYLMAIEGGKVVGSMRAVPTLEPTLLSELFPHLNLRAPIRRADVFELSRIFVLPEWRGERAGPRLEAALRSAIIEYGLSIGLTGFTIVLETWWLPRFEVDGWKARPLGLPLDIDGMSTLAVFVTCDEQTWLDICERRNIPGEILVWNGLGNVSRRSLRAPGPSYPAPVPR